MGSAAGPLDLCARGRLEGREEDVPVRDDRGAGGDMEGEVEACVVEPSRGGVAEEPGVLLECVGCADEPAEDAIG